MVLSYLAICCLLILWPGALPALGRCPSKAGCSIELAGDRHSVQCPSLPLPHTLPHSLPAPVTPRQKPGHRCESSTDTDDSLPLTCLTRSFPWEPIALFPPLPPLPVPHSGAPQCNKCLSYGRNLSWRCDAVKEPLPSISSLRLAPSTPPTNQWQGAWDLL